MTGGGMISGIGGHYGSSNHGSTEEDENKERNRMRVKGASI
jgi:hypothetical protein